MAKKSQPQPNESQVETLGGTQTIMRPPAGGYIPLALDKNAAARYAEIPYRNRPIKRNRQRGIIRCTNNTSA